MRYIEAPHSYSQHVLHRSVYLAGGITNCPDWQQQMVHLLRHTDYTLLNPRRKCFPISDPNASHEQITWEYHALRDASVILYWFPSETLCPIVLYELGAWSMTEKPFYVGVHPQYARRTDVEIQTLLVRPEVKIVYSLEDLAEQVQNHKFEQITRTQLKTA